MATGGRAGLVEATFVARPNRFVTRVRLDDGREALAHLADPGRLADLLVPGARLRLRPAPASPERRTAYGVALVRPPGAGAVWVSVDTALANRLAAGLLDRGVVRGLGAGGRVRREVGRGRSRFDFLVERPGVEPVWVEVKSVTLVERGIGRFPDAPTGRGRRHVAELTEIARSGGRAAVLFVAQRADARCVTAHRAIDPAFASLLADARDAGVLLRATRFGFEASGRARWLGPVPVRVARLRTPGAGHPRSAGRGPV